MVINGEQVEEFSTGSASAQRAEQLLDAFQVHAARAVFEQPEQVGAAAFGIVVLQAEQRAADAIAAQDALLKWAYAR